VIVPLVIGQGVQKTSKKAREAFTTHKRMVKKIQEICLIFIVYTVFCKTFEGNTSVGIGHVVLMCLYQFLLMIILMVVAWYSLRFLFHDEPELRVMGLYGCVQKTVALGVPLIASVYSGDPNEGLYTLPILVWHPMQLVLGSMLVPRLKTFIQVERKRLDAIASENDATVVGDVEDQEKGEVESDVTVVGDVEAQENKEEE
jgi:sodium/bile acid cotransporter 7